MAGSDAAVTAAFLRAYKQRAAEVACFGTGVMPSREWWRPLIRQTFEGAGVRPEHLEGTQPRAALLFSTGIDCHPSQFITDITIPCHP
jgi:hypothetical protein